MRCSLNIPGHPIIASKKLIMLPVNEMEKKNAISDDYISNHFKEITPLCSLIFQKQESREMSRQDKTTLFYQGSPVSCKAGILRGPGFNKNYI